MLVRGRGAVLLGLFLGFAICAPVHAEGRLEATYVASIAGLPIGRGVWRIEIGSKDYVASARGQVTGLLKIFADGSGSVAVDGSIDAAGRPVPTSYVARVTLDEGIDAVQMGLEAGNVTHVVVEPTYPPSSDRVPVLAIHRQGVLDPMTAGLIPGPPEGELLPPRRANAHCRSLMAANGLIWF